MFRYGSLIKAVMSRRYYEYQMLEIKLSVQIHNGQVATYVKHKILFQLPMLPCVLMYQHLDHRSVFLRILS